MIQRGRSALLTLPDRSGGLWCLAIGVGFAGLALPLAAWADFWAAPDAAPSLARILTFVAVSAFVPSLVEEFAFRGPWIPARGEAAPPGRVWLTVSVTTAAFVAWHPLNAWLVMPEARPIFWDPRFLLIVLALGGAAAAMRWRTGSIWPAWLLHWVTVLAWRLVFDGRMLLV